MTICAPPLARNPL